MFDATVWECTNLLWDLLMGTCLVLIDDASILMITKIAVNELKDVMIV